MKKKFFSKLVLASSVFLVSCASIVGGSSWLEMETKPENVEVTLVGVQRNTERRLITPFRVKLDRATDYRLLIETRNYRSEEIYIDRGINGWFWGNIVLGGPVGMLVDYATDAMWKHNPGFVSMDLTSLSTAPDEIEIKVPVKLDYPDGGYETVFLPIKFYKKQPGENQGVDCIELETQKGCSGDFWQPVTPATPSTPNTPLKR